ncbi:hypothetical protein V2J09_015236 [Rumex salicifolius]
MTSGCAAGGGGGGSVGGPCGACKYLRRKCVEGCIFSPYFDADQGAAHFAAVHRVFGASNASKLLLRIPPQRRFDAVVTLCYEALARVRDPVYGCVSHIFSLQQQVMNLQAELAHIQARLSTLQPLPGELQPPLYNNHRPPTDGIITSSTSTAATSASFDLQQALLAAEMIAGPPALPEPLLDVVDDDGCGDLHALSTELVYKYFSGAKFFPSD